jgi:hypothetical protein
VIVAFVAFIALSSVIIVLGSGMSKIIVKTVLNLNDVIEIRDRQ